MVITRSLRILVESVDSKSQWKVWKYRK